MSSATFSEEEKKCTSLVRTSSSFVIGKDISGIPLERAFVMTTVTAPFSVSWQIFPSQGFVSEVLSVENIDPLKPTMLKILMRSSLLQVVDCFCILFANRSLAEGAKSFLDHQNWMKCVDLTITQKGIYIQYPPERIVGNVIPSSTVKEYDYHEDQIQAYKEKTKYCVY